MRKFLFSNNGPRHHKIIISRQKAVRSWKYHEEVIESVFTIEPNVFPLKPNEKITVTLTGEKPNPECVTEDFYVHAMIQEVDKKQLLMSTVISAEFVKPLLKFSKRSMHFRIDFGIAEHTAFVNDNIVITNKSKLFLELKVKITPPFCIVDDKNFLTFLNVSLENDEDKTLDIHFNCESGHHQSLTVSGFLEFSYQEHPQVDKIPLKGEINYPNICFSPHVINFGNLPLGCYSHFGIEVRNISPLPVSFYWEWAEVSLIDSLPAVEEPYVPVPVPESVASTKTSGISESQVLLLQLEETGDGKKTKKKKGSPQKKSRDKSSAGSKKEKSPKSTSKASPRSRKSTAKSKRDKQPKLLPFELIFQHYYVEINDIFHEIQITLLYREPMTTWHLIRDSETNERYHMEIKKVLYPVLMQHYVPNMCNPASEELTTVPAQLDEVSEVVSLVPSSGYLLPYESQVMHVGFRRAEELNVRVKAICHILAGRTEYIDVTGTCSDIHFQLDKTFVDFHRQVCTHLITLFNLEGIK